MFNLVLIFSSFLIFLFFKKTSHLGGFLWLLITQNKRKSRKTIEIKFSYLQILSSLKHEIKQMHSQVAVSSCVYAMDSTSKLYVSCEWPDFICFHFHFRMCQLTWDKKLNTCFLFWNRYGWVYRNKILFGERKLDLTLLFRKTSI